MQTPRRIAVAIAVAGGLAWPALLPAAEPAAAAGEASQTQRPRLKYRDGPVCICVTGMSEQDIRAANQKHEASEAPVVRAPPPKYPSSGN